MYPFATGGHSIAVVLSCLFKAGGYNHSHGRVIKSPVKIDLSDNAVSFQPDLVGNVQTLAFKIILLAGSLHIADGGSAYGAIGRSRGTAHGLCGHVQLATA